MEPNLEQLALGRELTKLEQSHEKLNDIRYHDYELASRDLGREQQSINEAKWNFILDLCSQIKHIDIGRNDDPILQLSLDRVKRSIDSQDDSFDEFLDKLHLAILDAKLYDASYLPSLQYTYTLIKNTL